MRIFVIGMAAFATMSSAAVLAQGAMNPGTPPTTGNPASSGGMQPQPTDPMQANPAMPETPAGPDNSGRMMPGQAPGASTATPSGDRSTTMPDSTAAGDRTTNSTTTNDMHNKKAKRPR
ncbi:hypothetical protein [Sphingomonas quercus]|uniref:Uncharacterized protein n=1 Tax=Sphingomonas quercus TaxID=2842451 RepID=A0ABS6BJR1_9SPHN|nr:hypothetical protein [Sphingomonas quercus]MBU3078102.1 hypothetical protein [Sphingomonas quercus]